MIDQVVDLRSDTVTTPDGPMRQAMAVAEVGDDVIDVDPTVAKLQERIAQMLGKEAALFVPSGTMANQIAVRLHCRAGDELVCEATSHIYFFEQGGYAQLSGVVAKTIPGNSGVLTRKDLVEAVWPDDEHFVRTRLLWIENTHNMGGGSIQPFDVLEDLRNWATSHQLSMHLDGARLFNAVVASGRKAHEWASLFDTVSVCFSKGLGAPVGSAIAGTKEQMAIARRHRKLFGGGMRQAGVIAAAALYALENNLDDLAQDHQNAAKLGDFIRGEPGLELVTDPIETNMLYFRLIGTQISADQFVQSLEENGVRTLAVGDTVRAVTHRDVSADQIEQAIARIQRILSEY